MSATIDLLGHQHHDVLLQLAAVDAGLTADGAFDLAPFAAYLAGEVCEHFTLEEEALFPIMAQHIGNGHGPLAVMDAEHVAFRDLLGTLQSALEAGDQPGQRNAAADIIQLLRGHIHKEDFVLFPMATNLLSLDEHDEIDRRAAALRNGTAPA